MKFTKVLPITLAAIFAFAGASFAATAPKVENVDYKLKLDDYFDLQEVTAGCVKSVSTTYAGADYSDLTLAEGGLVAKYKVISNLDAAKVRLISTCEGYEDAQVKSMYQNTGGTKTYVAFSKVGGKCSLSDGDVKAAAMTNTLESSRDIIGIELQTAYSAKDASSAFGTVTPKAFDSANQFQGFDIDNGVHTFTFTMENVDQTTFSAADSTGDYVATLTFEKYTTP